MLGHGFAVLYLLSGKIFIFKLSGEIASSKSFCVNPNEIDFHKYEETIAAYLFQLMKHFANSFEEGKSSKSYIH